MDRGSVLSCDRYCCTNSWVFIHYFVLFLFVYFISFEKKKNHGNLFLDLSIRFWRLWGKNPVIMKNLLKYRFKQVDISFIIWQTLMMSDISFIIWQTLMMSNKRKLKSFQIFIFWKWLHWTEMKVILWSADILYFFNEMFGNKMCQAYIKWLENAPHCSSFFFSELFQFWLDDREINVEIWNIWKDTCNTIWSKSLRNGIVVISLYLYLNTCILLENIYRITALFMVEVYYREYRSESDMTSSVTSDNVWQDFQNWCYCFFRWRHTVWLFSVSESVC